MKALVIHNYGAPEVMKLEDRETPSPGPGQLLIDVAVSGVNFMDTAVRKGHAAAIPGLSLPHGVGVEGAGTVARLGPGVKGLEVGDRVAWVHIWGSYASQVIASADALVRLPDGIDFETAASLMMQGLTASNCVLETHFIKPGDVALIHSAAGGVGFLLTQMVTILGGRAIGIVSSEDKVAIVSNGGAINVIVDKHGLFADQVIALTGDGVSVVYDGASANGFDESIRCLDYHGTLALLSPLTASTGELDVFRLPRSIKVTFPVFQHHVRTHDRLVQRSNQLFEWVLAGKLKTHIGGRYPLADAARAHADLQSRKTKGKLLLIA